MTKEVNQAPTRRHVLQAIGAAAAVPLFSPKLAQAQTLPDVVRIVVAFPAGNPVEAPGRAMAQALNQTSGRNYIIDNKPGAGGLLGAREVAKSKPDGSTLLWVNASHTIAPSIYKKLPFDAVNDFTPVSKILTTTGFALLVGRDSPFRTVQDLIKAGQEKPEAISYASYGIGNTIHLIGALFGNAVHAKFLHVPYNNSPVPDLVAGRVNFTFLGIDISKQLVEAGQVRVLAVTSERRVPHAPNAPTYAELGIKGVEVPGWGGVLGPRGMSPQVTDKLWKEMAVAVKHKAFLDYVNAAGEMQVVANSPAEFAPFIKSEVDRYRKLLAPLNLQLDSGF